jgi:hypothetical protein
MNLLDGLKVQFNTSNRWSFSSDDNPKEGIIIQTSLNNENKSSQNIFVFAIMCCSGEDYYNGKIYVRNADQIKLKDGDIKKLTMHPEKMVKRVKTTNTIKEEGIKSRFDILGL